MDIQSSTFRSKFWEAVQFILQYTNKLSWINKLWEISATVKVAISSTSKQTLLYIVTFQTLECYMLSKCT